MKTPIFGPYNVTRSTNFADNQLINLRPEVGEPRGDGKAAGALYGTPGLDLLTACGGGPINGLRPLGEVLYVVSGVNVYTTDASWFPTAVGAVAGTGRVSMIDNGAQIAIFSDRGGYVGPAGYPLTSGTIGAGGINYAVGDTIVLFANDGTQSAAAIIEVSSVSGAAVTGFTVIQTGAFQTNPSGFVQQSTTGSGTGFTLTVPIFGAARALCHLFLPFAVTGPISAAYQDGFGLIGEPNSMRLWQSQNSDLSVWPALNFAIADGESDNIVSLESIHREVYVTKQRSTEVWNDAGAAGFSFQPLSSVMIETGNVAWASAAKLGESLIWLTRSSQGNGIVREIEGFTPKRISTHAVETLLAACSTLDDAFGYAYQQEGHQYYVLTLPTGNLTLVYDKTASALAGAPMWHQWLSFAAGSFARHWGNAFAFFGGSSVLGDYRNGNLYRINLNTLTDNGTPRKWLRVWRALQDSTMQPMQFSSLQIDMQTGAGVPDGTSPLVMLRWSDDGGHNWATQLFQMAGAPGQTAQRVKFNRLGSTRRNSGLDRIFELSSTDAFPVCIINAEINA